MNQIKKALAVVGVVCLVTVAVTLVVWDVENGMHVSIVMLVMAVAVVMWPTYFPMSYLLRQRRGVFAANQMVKTSVSPYESIGPTEMLDWRETVELDRIAAAMRKRDPLLGYKLTLVQPL